MSRIGVDERVNLKRRIDRKTERNVKGADRMNNDPA